MKIFRLLYRAAAIWLLREADIHAAALAYFVPFAITPLLLLSITIVGFFIGGNQVGILLLRWGNSLDPELTDLIFVSVKNFDNLTTSYYLPFLATIFFSLMVVVTFNSLVSGLNKIWQIESNGWKKFFRRSGRSFLFFVFLQCYLIGLILIDQMFVFLYRIQFIDFLEYVRPVILFGSTLILFTLSYGILTLRPPSFRARFYGAVVASSLIIFTKELVALHTATAPIPGLFGTAGLIIVLLVWIYISTGIIFYGASFAAAYEESKRSTQITK